MSPAEYDGLILNISVASDAGQRHGPPVALLWHWHQLTARPGKPGGDTWVNRTETT